MPELAEVEFMAQRLDAWLRDGDVTLEVIDPKLARPELLQLGTLDVQRVYRRAKYAIIESPTVSLAVHFRMTGKVLPSTTVVPHTRARFVGTRATINFIDMRRFGTLEPFDTQGADAFFAAKGLGLEPWPARRSGTWWKDALAGLKGPIKAALLRQDRVVGIGNILALECLHRARIAPTRPVPAIEDHEWTLFAAAFHEVVTMILSGAAGDEIAYINEGASPEASGFLVYQREGEPAACCGAPIERVKDAGRSTFWCPQCQR